MLTFRAASGSSPHPVYPLKKHTNARPNSNASHPNMERIITTEFSPSIRPRWKKKAMKNKARTDAKKNKKAKIAAANT